MYIVARKLDMNRKERSESSEPIEPNYSVYQEAFHTTAEEALVAYNDLIRRGHIDGFIAKMLTIKTVLIDVDGTHVHELPL